MRGRSMGSSSPNSPSLKGLGYGSWEDRAVRAMEREGVGLVGGLVGA